MLRSDEVFDPPPNRLPRLLVSVRNAAEAAAALAGGADIVDVKEPARGALGRADFAQIESVWQTVRDHGCDSPVSAALGEALDWADDDAPSSIPCGLDYVKVGTAGLGRDANWRTLWPNRVAGLAGWNRERRQPGTIRVSQSTTDHPPPSTFPPPPSIIPVAYADWRLAESPPPADAVAFAIESRCAGVLIDTFVKQGQRLFDWLDDGKLRRLVTTCHRSGLWLAAAGSLDVPDLPRLCDAGVDIVGIRSAACRRRLRLSTIDSAAVTEFQRALRQSWNATRRSAAAIRADCTN
jgi:hypothetical protein